MKILIVDDEALARQRLVRLVGELGSPYVLGGEAANGRAALEQCREKDIDLVLMDIRMPGMSGLEAATELSAEKRPPAIIFTTAHEEHALSAFDTHAVAYLLKPIRKEKLQSALEKASVMTRVQQGVEETNELFLTTSYRGGIQRVPLSEVFYLQADNKYVVVRHADGEALLEESLKSLEARLASHFLRIHRNALVALDKLNGLEKDSEGRPVITFIGLDARLEVSRRHVAAVRQFFKGSD